MKQFNFEHPTVQMLGRWQPWHEGHTELFRKALEITGQVCIMIRTVSHLAGEDAGAGRTNIQDDNPFSLPQVRNEIVNALSSEGYEYGKEYIIMFVPNIVDISYGRGVGYTFTEHDLGKDIHNISATKIREQMRQKGEL